MKTYPFRSTALCALLFLQFCLPEKVLAQQGPQDSWTYYGTQFSSPTAGNNLRSIAIGSGGVYVGEQAPPSYEPTKILRFTEAGAFVSRFSATFTYILGLACDSAGNVYVLDRGDSKVKVFDASGTFLRQWGGAGAGDGQFAFSTQNGPTMISINRNDQVYVADPGNTRIQVFTANGAFLRKWGQAGSLPGQFNPGSPLQVVVSGDDRVYAAAKVFDLNGNYISGGLNGDQLVYAASSDGMVIFGIYGYQLRYPGGGSTSLNTGESSTDDAFSKRGDVFSNNGLKVSVFRREYLSSVNFLAPTGIPQPVILSSKQRPGTSLVDIDYLVTDVDNSTLPTGLLAFKNNGGTLGDAIVMNTFVEGTAGNVGLNQPTGSVRHVTWNMPADWAVDYANIQVEALAKDSRNLLGIHYITIPASGVDPAVAVSFAPVTDRQLLDLWFWFLSTHDGCSLTRSTGSFYGQTLDIGIVRGTVGVYTGQTLASYTPYSSADSAITPAGRLFLYEKMGVRQIYGKELARAQAGNFGFSSFDEKRTVVKEVIAATSYLKGYGYNSYNQANWLSFAGVNPVKVATSGNHSLILRADGSLWAVGNNGNGQLGDGTTVDRSGPVLMASGVAQIAVGANHTLFVKTDGTLWAVGYNAQGQLGDGTLTGRTTPVQIATNVSQVAAGSYFSAFVKNDGTLWTMGQNNLGQLGDGTNTDRSSPVQIATGVGQVSAGGAHTLFVKPGGNPAGTLWVVGYNDQGQLGDGTTTRRTTPVQVATGVAQAFGGSNHSLFLKTNGTLWAMGYNYYGQLGDGTTTQRNAPIQIASDVSTAAAGGGHSLFLKTDGTLWSMGNNGSGQLADGTTTNRLTPVQADAGVTAIAAGGDTTLEVVIPTP